MRRLLAFVSGSVAVLRSGIAAAGCSAVSAAVPFAQVGKRYRVRITFRPSRLARAIWASRAARRVVSSWPGFGSSVGQSAQKRAQRVRVSLKNSRLLALREFGGPPGVVAPDRAQPNTRGR